MQESHFFKEIFLQSIACKKQFIDTQCSALESIAQLITQQIRIGHKVLLFGNGGSAADAQHIAAELINRLTFDRPAIPAIALTTDTSVLTSIANDASYHSIFSRQIEALGSQDDIAIAISTSGNSENVIRGVLTANAKNMISIGLLGETGGKLKDIVQHPLIVPAQSAQRIQEIHITIAHALCEYIERSLFGTL